MLAIQFLTKACLFKLWYSSIIHSTPCAWLVINLRRSATEARAVICLEYRESPVAETMYQRWFSIDSFYLKDKKHSGCLREWEANELQVKKWLLLNDNLISQCMWIMNWRTPFMAQRSCEVILFHNNTRCEVTAMNRQTILILGDEKFCPTQSIPQTSDYMFRFLQDILLGQHFTSIKDTSSHTGLPQNLYGKMSLISLYLKASQQLQKL